MSTMTDCPRREWTEKARVTEPNEHGRYMLTVWDGSQIDRGFPSKYSDCALCGASRIESLGDSDSNHPAHNSPKERP